jgi:hypothetical protein
MEEMVFDDSRAVWEFGSVIFDLIGSQAPLDDAQADKLRKLAIPLLKVGMASDMALAALEWLNAAPAQRSRCFRRLTEASIAYETKRLGSR